jgi:hypothetical protein
VRAGVVRYLRLNRDPARPDNAREIVRPGQTMKGAKMRDDRVTRCLVCGGWMIDICQNCADRTERRAIYERIPDVDAKDIRYAEAMAVIAKLTAERDQARRIAVALEQETAEPPQCGCAAIVQGLHDKWTTMPAHQLAAIKILDALGQ